MSFWRTKNSKKITSDSIAVKTDGTTLKDLLDSLKSAGGHNSIYRGKDITTLFYNGTLSTQIANGTFDDIFVGDYIIGQNSGRKYIVADINYSLTAGQNSSGTSRITTNHIVLVPEKSMGTAKMNDSNITTNGYAESKMRSTYLTPFKTIINNDFGSNHVLSYNELLSAGSDWWWVNSVTVELMSEVMVYGHNVRASNIKYESGINKKQLALFRLEQSKMIVVDDNNTYTGYWLRDPASSTQFARVDFNGMASSGNASDSLGVRPAFLVY